jgi:hypothetical protein
MRLTDIAAFRLSIAAGGPGSGCHGPNCGRPSKGASAIPKSEFPLTAKQKLMEGRFRRQIGGNLEQAKAKYRHDFGNVLNADNAKELSEDYLKDRSHGAAAVHEPASYLIKELYKEELAKPAKAGKENDVVFTAGGAGAGKTTGLADIPSLQRVQDRAHIVYDGTLRPASSAIKKIDQALAAGKQATVIYVHRDPEGAFRDGVLSRADRQEKQYGSGRTVMLDEFAAQHASIQDSMKQVADRYKGNPNFHMHVIDNSRGKGNAVMSNLNDLPKNASADVLKSKLKGVLDEAYKNGNISRTVYKATLGSGAGKEVGM